MRLRRQHHALADSKKQSAVRARSSPRSHHSFGGEFESRRSEPIELRSLRACLRSARSRGSNAPGVGASLPSSRKPSRVSCPSERQAPRAKVRSERVRNRAQRATCVDERSCSARGLSLAGVGLLLQLPDARLLNTNTLRAPSSACALPLVWALLHSRSFARLIPRGRARRGSARRSGGARTA